MTAPASPPSPPARPASRRAGRIAVFVALVSLIALFFLTCEKREIEIPRGFHGEAARNPYLAAQRMLEKLGTPVRSFPDLASMTELPPPDALLILPTARRTLTRPRAQALMRWVEEGGHLLVVTWQLYDDPKRSPDFVLDPLGVRQFMNGDDEEGADDDDAAEPDDEPAPIPPPPAPRREPTRESPITKAQATVSDDEADDEEEEDPGPELALAEFPDRPTPLRVEFDPRFRLDLDETAIATWIFDIGDANGLHLVTLKIGKGLVTALTDDYFMTHFDIHAGADDPPTIEDWDHAELVYRLAHFDGRPRPVWIVYGDDYPSALALLWRNGWMVVASAAIVLALWLWSASRRFGPLAPDPALERRELMEHVRAAGRFQWRRAAAPALLEATREALLARVRERHPNFAGLTPAEQADRLAALSDLPSARIAAALAFRTDTLSSHFAEDIAVLEKIRRSL